MPSFCTEIFSRFLIAGTTRLPSLIVAVAFLHGAPALSQTYRGVTQLAAGGSHTCTLEANGDVKCWGINFAGQLGVGDILDRQRPQAVPGLSRVTQISANDLHTCAVEAGGGVKCWGRNLNGELGVGDRIDRPYPVPVPGLSGAQQIVTGQAHTCALMLDATVSCWGSNLSGELGLGSFSAPLPTPQRVAGLQRIKQLSAGANHTCALDELGVLRCWGGRVDGVSDVVGPGVVARPKVIPGLETVSQIVSGRSHACVLERRGVFCWGNNQAGQLGIGNAVSQATPQPVPGLAAAGHFSAGGLHTCAVTVQGAFQCWGRNSHGQLGVVGDGLDRWTPQDAVLAGVTHVAAGFAHTCALVAQGEVKCWGRNRSLLGLPGGGAADQLTPASVLTCDISVVTGDCDNDGVPNGVELTAGGDPDLRDNDIFSGDTGGQQAFVRQLYRDLLGREADASGRAFWAAALAAGSHSRSTMAQSFLFSPEAESTEGQAARLYFAAFQRPPDRGGLVFWADQLRQHLRGTTVPESAIAAVAQSFASTNEFWIAYRNLDDAGFVDRMYRNVLGRPADASGLAFWVGQMQAPTRLTRGQVLMWFANSGEFRRVIDGDVAVTRLYLAMLRRPPDAAGLAFWADHLESGESLIGLLDAFINSREYRARFLPE